MNQNKLQNPQGFKKKPHSRAQATIEFMLALPILLLIIFGIIDFALLFQAWLSVQNIARQTVRYAVTGEYNDAHCVDLASDGACAGVDKDAEEDAARLVSIHDVADSFIIGLMEDQTITDQLTPRYIDITVCSNRFTFFAPTMGLPPSTVYSRCMDGASATEDAGGAGGLVIVSVDFNHPFVTPFINVIWPSFHLISTRRGIVENFRVARDLPAVPLAMLPTYTPSNTPTIIEYPHGNLNTNKYSYSDAVRDAYTF